MGQSASTAARSYKAAEAAAKATTNAASNLQHGAGAVAADAERAAVQHARRAALTLEEEEQLESKDQGLGSLLDKIGGSIHGKAVNVMPAERRASLLPSSAGRLPAHAMKELLELQRQAAGAPVDATHFITKYSADPKLIEQVLSRVCLPDLVEAGGSAGVEAYAQFPDWFERHSNSSR